MQRKDRVRTFLDERPFEASSLAGFVALALVILYVIYRRTHGEDDSVLPNSLQDSYKWAFLVGMSLSIWAQTTTAAFFKLTETSQNRLLDVGIYLTTPLFPIFGANSFLSMGNLEEHMNWTLAFVFLAWVMDLFAVSQSGGDKVLRRRCFVLAERIDGLSAFGLGLLVVLAIPLGHLFSASHDGTLAKSVYHQFKEVFLSGAVGFHLLAAAWLLFTFLRDWSEITVSSGDHNLERA